MQKLLKRHIKLENQDLQLKFDFFFFFFFFFVGILFELVLNSIKSSQQLLDYEPRAADQVPLLISMQEDERALIKAIESGDTDLGNFRSFRKMRKMRVFEIN